MMAAITGDGPSSRTASVPSRAPEGHPLAQIGAFRVQYKIDENHTMTVRCLEYRGNIHGLP